MTNGRNAIPRSSGLWTNAWAEFVPFLQFDNAIRQVIYTTNAIESVNARIRRAIKARGHFPTEAAALKCVYLAIMSLDPKGTARQRWSKPMEGSTECLRDNVRRTAVCRTKVVRNQSITPFSGQTHHVCSRQICESPLPPEEVNALC